MAKEKYEIAVTLLQELIYESVIFHGLVNQSQPSERASDDEKISLASNALSDNEECGNLRSYTFLLGKNSHEYRL